ncbi:MAG: BPL-N domain-containing protein, partial [Nitrospirota bacterium]
MPKPKVAFLWDESFLWGLMAYKNFKALGVDAGIVTSNDIREGVLERCDILFVPGGWSSDKSEALGKEGCDAVRGFVSSGGSYVGFCGGAGLALSTEGGLSLTRVTRVPTKHRVPSFSGEIELGVEDTGHPLWSGVAPPYCFHAWWPGQFKIAKGDDVRVVARYGAPGKDFYIADLAELDVEIYDDGWSHWEEEYGINLNPTRLMGEPAIIETSYGKGNVLLSNLHLETPGCVKGNRALLNMMGYLMPSERKRAKSARAGKKGEIYPVGLKAIRAAEDMMDAVHHFIRFGERNFLWYWRNPWLLQWRRGVRG